MNWEFRNMFKGIGLMMGEMFAIILGLSRVSYCTGAGTAAFQLSLIFVFSQAIVLTVTYIQWYRTVNRLAADLYNTKEKRKTAFRYIIPYLTTAVVISGVISLVAVIATISQIIFYGISPIYCFSSILSEFIIGSITLWILMRFFGLPDRVLNRYW